jgi:hypothetical protein
MERPIIFKDDMVRAILEGRKTQTRRIMKPQPVIGDDGWFRWDGHKPNSKYGAYASNQVDLKSISIFVGLSCPYGRPGDRLWVRETFYQPVSTCLMPWGEYETSWRGWKEDIEYAADGKAAPTLVTSRETKVKRPSIHMPRFASRITLEISGVRVERLQDISEEDAIAEGARHFPDLPGTSPYGQDDRWSMETPDSCDKCLGNARMAFANYFCKITGNAPKGLHDPRPWDANPWVWVIEFRRVD